MLLPVSGKNQTEICIARKYGQIILISSAYVFINPICSLKGFYHEE